MSVNEEKVSFKCLKDVLGEDLSIPYYQRPYSWKKKQVEYLLNDVLEQFSKNTDESFMLGTLIVFHDNKYEVVDGQQRLVTLTLIIHALNCMKQVDSDSLKLLNAEFSHSESCANISANYKYIEDWVKNNYSDALLNFLINHIQFVWLEAPTLDDAFTFFDSQNSRGKVLERYDLLKAYHLLFTDEAESNAICLNWESIAKDNIHFSTLINKIITRTRLWIKNDFKTDLDAYNEFSKDIFENSAINRYDKGILKNGIGAKFFDYVFNYNSIYCNFRKLRNAEFSFYNELATLDDYYEYILETYEAVMVLYFDCYGFCKLEQFSNYLLKLLLVLRFERQSVKKESPKVFIQKTNVFNLIYNSSYGKEIFDELKTVIEGYKYQDNGGIRGSYYEHIGKELLKINGLPKFKDEKVR